MSRAGDWLFAWTPPHGTFIGAVGLRNHPSEALTRSRYRSALINRIDLMVQAIRPETAIRQLQVAYDREGLDITDPTNAGLILVENSDALAEHCSFGLDEVSVDELIHEPHTLRRLRIGPGSLRRWIAGLYPD